MKKVLRGAYSELALSLLNVSHTQTAFFPEDETNPNAGSEEVQKCKTAAPNERGSPDKGPGASRGSARRPARSGPGSDYVQHSLRGVLQPNFGMFNDLGEVLMHTLTITFSYRRTGPVAVLSGEPSQDQDVDEGRRP